MYEQKTKKETCSRQVDENEPNDEIMRFFRVRLDYQRNGKHNGTTDDVDFRQTNVIQGNFP